MLILYMQPCGLLPADLAQTYTLCAVGSQQGGDAQCWAGFVHLETMSLRGHREPVSLRDPKGVLLIPPLQLAHVCRAHVSPDHF